VGAVSSPKIPHHATSLLLLLLMMMMTMMMTTMTMAVLRLWRLALRWKGLVRPWIGLMPDVAGMQRAWARLRPLPRTDRGCLGAGARERPLLL
jgi:hypothetical protein